MFGHNTERKRFAYDRILSFVNILAWKTFHSLDSSFLHYFHCLFHSVVSVDNGYLVFLKFKSLAFLVVQALPASKELTFSLLDTKSQYILKRILSAPLAQMAVIVFESISLWTDILMLVLWSHLKVNMARFPYMAQKAMQVSSNKPFFHRYPSVLRLANKILTEMET